jgi:hypothetical protein
LEWARPMNFVPISATESVRRFGIWLKRQD